MIIPVNESLMGKTAKLLAAGYVLTHPQKTYRAITGAGTAAYEKLTGHRIGQYDKDKGKNKENSWTQRMNDEDELEGLNKVYAARLRRKNGFITGSLQNKAANAKAQIHSFGGSKRDLLRAKLDQQKKYLNGDSKDKDLKESCEMIAEALDNIALYLGNDGNFYVNESDVVDYGNAIGYSSMGSILEDIAIINNINIDNLYVV